jgi:chemotaxis family two-component system response regulator Rcp1
MSLQTPHLVPLPAFLASPPGRSFTPDAHRVGEGERADAGAERRLLLVEDNPADADLVVEALGGLPYPVHVSTALDGEHALAALQEAARSGALPDLVLLDLNLPRMSGHEVLAQVKTDPALCDVPVVVLTSSSAVQDSDAARALRAEGFVTKPLELEEYLRTIQATARRWLQRSHA